MSEEDRWVEEQIRQNEEFTKQHEAQLKEQSKYKLYMFKTYGTVWAKDEDDATSFVEDAILDGCRTDQTEIRIEETKIFPLSSEDTKRLTKKYDVQDQQEIGIGEP